MGGKGLNEMRGREEREDGTKIGNMERVKNEQQKKERNILSHKNELLQDKGGQKKK